MALEHTTHLPEYALAFEPYLYNRISFLRLKDYPVRSFYAVDHQKKVITARIHFAREDAPDDPDRTVSIPEAPFGSVEYGETATLAQLTEFLTYVKEQLTRQSATAVEIRDCIPAYRPYSQQLLPRAMAHLNFAVCESAANHHIPVDNTAYIHKIHRMEAKRLRKCYRARFSFVPEPLSELEAVYHFLARCRAERGWELSVSLDHLREMTRRLPGAYRLFSVYDAHRRIAASLLAVVNTRVVYDFYHDALQSYNRYSPTVMLLAGLYDHCQQQGVKILDMGTSTTDSLAAFKARVGGVMSRKQVFRYTG